MSAIKGGLLSQLFCTASLLGSRAAVTLVLISPFKFPCFPYVFLIITICFFKWRRPSSPLGARGPFGPLGLTKLVSLRRSELGSCGAPLGYTRSSAAACLVNVQFMYACCCSEYLALDELKSWPLPGHRSGAATWLTRY